MTTCAAIIAGLGYECREVKDNILEVDTAFSYADGSTISVYVMHSPHGFVLSDNADSIYHLISVGIPIRSRSSLSPIKRLASAHGVTLTGKGELRTECQPALLGDGMARFISTMVEISRYERERVGLPESVVIFSDEVELYLRGWKQGEEITRAPTIRGATGGLYEFDFRISDYVIDCIAAKGRSTGALLRKSADIRAQDHAPSIMAVIDDRTDPDHAARESDILVGSGLVSVLPMTRLMKNANAHHSEQ